MSQPTKDFFELVKNIGESRSKLEEDRIIFNEVRSLKTNMAAKSVESKLMREYLIRMLYVEMLGHDASFGHIHAVNMLSSKNLLEKRVAYLAVSLTLTRDSPLLLLVVNSLRNDLASSNYLEVSMALGVLSKLVNPDILPAVFPHVLQLIEHEQPLVRKKAVMCLHRIYKLDSKNLEPHENLVRRALCDRDPAVMGTTLILILDLAQANPSGYKDLVPSLLSILKQVVEHKLPTDYDYHRIPAPWIQMSLLKLLSILGAADHALSSQMYDILGDCMKRAAIGTNIGYAIVYECVRTITTIYPSGALIEAAAQAVSHFLTSENHNLKYLGVTSLAGIVTIDPAYAADHQLVVLDCLEDPDDTLRRKTVELLYSMTNSQNVTAIVNRLLTFLSTATDVFLRTELVTRLSQLAEKFAPSTEWYITTMNQIFELGGDLVRPELANGLLRLLATAGETRDESLAELGIDGLPGALGDLTVARQAAVDMYIELLQSKKTIPDVMVKTLAWVLGEYGHLSSTLPPAQLVDLLVEAAEGVYIDRGVLPRICNAIQMLLAHVPIPPSQGTLALLRKFQSSRSCELLQRSQECQALLQNRKLMAAVLPIDAHSTPVRVDESLSFLDGFVSYQLQAGAKAYQSRDQLDASRAESERMRQEMKSASLKFQAYERPAQPEPQTFTLPSSTSAPAISSSTVPPKTGAVFADTNLQLEEVTSVGTSTGIQGARLKPASARVWGPKGFNAAEREREEKEAAEAAAEEARLAEKKTAAAVPSEAPIPGSVKAHVSPSTSANPTYISPSGAVLAAPAVAKPRALTEREIQAKSLFAGVGAQPTASRASGLKPFAAAAVQPAPVPAATHVPIPAPVQTQAASSPPAVNVLADLLGTATVSSPVANPSPVSSSASSVDVFGIFGDSSSATSAVSSQAHTPAAAASASSSSGSVFDFLGSQSGADGSNVTSPVSIFNQSDSDVSTRPVGADANIPTLASILGSETPNSAIESVYVDNGVIRVSTATVSLANQTCLVVYVSNVGTSGSLNGLSVDVLFPPHALPAAFVPTLHRDKYIASSTDVNRGRTNGQGMLVASVGDLPPRGTCAVLISLTGDCQPALISATPQLNVQTPAGKLSVSLNGSLPFASLLRPYNIVTKSYGELWKSLGSATETKTGQVRTTVASPSDVESRLRSVSLHIVQTIKAETIASCTLLGASAQPVLCHVKLASDGTLSIHIRSRDSALSATVAEKLKLALQ